MVDLMETLNADEQRTCFSPNTGKLQRAGESLGIAVGNTVAKSRKFAARMRERAEQVKEEKPLQLLAVLAGVAVVAGFATRIWRSSGNA